MYEAGRDIIRHPGIQDDTKSSDLWQNIWPKGFSNDFRTGKCLQSPPPTVKVYLANPTHVDLIGRQPKWKKTSMEENLNGRRPQQKMTSM